MIMNLQPTLNVSEGCALVPNVPSLGVGRWGLELVTYPGWSWGGSWSTFSSLQIITGHDSYPNKIDQSTNLLILIDVLVGDGGLSNRIVRIHAQGRVELIADDLLLSAPDVDLPDVSGGRARCGWGNGRELRRHWRGGSEAASTVGSGSDVARSGKCLRHETDDNILLWFLNLHVKKVCVDIFYLWPKMLWSRSPCWERGMNIIDSPGCWTDQGSCSVWLSDETWFLFVQA